MAQRGKTITLPDGSTYTGNLSREGLPHGSGVQTFSNGDTFEGFFVQGQKNGIGRYEKKSQYVYFGNFARNKMTGQGTITFSNGRHYKGHFVDGKFHGEGVLTFPNQQVQQGQFSNGLFVE